MMEVAGKLILEDPVIKGAVPQFIDVVTPEALAIDFTVSHAVATDADNVTLTAIGQEADSYVWLLDDKVIGTGQVLTFNPVENGVKSITLVASDSTLNLSGRITKENVISLSVKLAEDHIIRCGDLNATTQAAVRQLMWRIRSDQEMWNEMQREGGAFGMLIHQESMASALKDCFGRWGAKGYYESPKRKYFDLTAFNNPTLDVDGVAFNGIDQWIERLDGNEPASTDGDETTFSGLALVIHLSKEAESFSAGWLTNADNSFNCGVTYNTGANRVEKVFRIGRIDGIMYGTLAETSTAGIHGGVMISVPSAADLGETYWDDWFSDVAGDTIVFCGYDEKVATAYQMDPVVSAAYPNLTLVNNDRYGGLRGLGLGNINRGLIFGASRNSINLIGLSANSYGQNQLGIVLAVPCKTPYAYERLAAYTKEYLTAIGRTNGI